MFIGVGINSLGAAVLLGEAGWRVLVLDRNEEPGGAVRTMQLTLPGFHHDIGAMNLTARFESDAAQALIAAWGLHLDYAPDFAGGCWMPFIETNVDQRQGISLVKGGSVHVIGALSQMVRESGGEVRTSQTVEKILFEKGRAVAWFRGIVMAHIEFTANGVLMVAFGFLVKELRLGPTALKAWFATLQIGTWTNGAAGVAAAFLGATSPLMPTLNETFPPPHGVDSPIVSGILQLCGVTNIAALLLTLVGLLRAKASARKQSGRPVDGVL